jgi:hypothetical protein
MIQLVSTLSALVGQKAERRDTLNQSKRKLILYSTHWSLYNIVIWSSHVHLAYTKRNNKVERNRRLWRPVPRCPWVACILTPAAAILPLHQSSRNRTQHKLNKRRVQELGNPLARRHPPLLLLLEVVVDQRREEEESGRRVSFFLVLPRERRCSWRMEVVLGRDLTAVLEERRGKMRGTFPALSLP